MFSGSYAPEDVTFLLKRVEIAPTPVEEKEAAIQSGARHYSEMISEERRPDDRYMAIFSEALDRAEARIAGDIATLAATVRARIAAGRLPARITLASLVRAGVPYGVLLRRALAAQGVDVAHYGVSIIRDRGLDGVAMAHILAERPAEGVVFVDGWTGKGAIAGELARSWPAISGRAPVLAVLADPCGRADLAAGHEDWLIPSGILGANVSGLISRSILNDRVVGPGEFHGAMEVGHLADLDVSRAFVDRISGRWGRVGLSNPPYETPEALREELRAAAEGTVARILAEAGTENRNRVKPGIAEATRAVLRRAPERVYVADRSDPDLAALVHLCEVGNTPLVEGFECTRPYKAVTLIRRVT